MSDDLANENVGKTWIFISTLIFSALFIYIGYNPSTGPALVMSQGLLSLAALASLLSIAIKGGKCVWYKYQNESYPLIKFIRPITLFLLTAILFFSLKPQEAEAIKFLERQAEIATSLCNSVGKCPESLDGWVKYDSRYQYKFISSGNTLFHMYYVAKGDTFNIYISYGLDMAYRLNGGVNMQVSKGWKNAP